MELHQGLALSPFLFAVVIDRLTDEVRQESLWAVQTLICSKSRVQVDESQEMWRYVLERRGKKVSRSKTESMCVNETEAGG